MLGLFAVLVFVSKKRFSRAVWLGIALLLVVSICIVTPLLGFKFHEFVADVNAYASGAGMGTSQGQRLILWGISPPVSGKLSPLSLVNPGA